MVDGVLERGTGHAPFGVPWLDEPARDDVVVRISRSAGLPAPLPDVFGLAVRIPDGPVDLLLWATPIGPVVRFVPVPRRDAATAYTSIMGYRSDAGTLRLAALPDDGSARRFTMAAARGQGPWRPFGRLVLGAAREPVDPGVRFDAVGNPPHGLVPDGPLARFRARAYAAARRGRAAS
nr:phosphodiesterase [Petropleomorpha daqingensis]